MTMQFVQRIMQREESEESSHFDDGASMEISNDVDAVSGSAQCKYSGCNRPNRAYNNYYNNFKCILNALIPYFISFQLKAI